VFWKPAIYSGKDIVYRAEAWIKPGTERLIALAPQDEPRSNRVWAEFDLRDMKLARQVGEFRSSGFEPQADGWIKIWTEFTARTPDFTVELWPYGQEPNTTLTLGGVLVRRSE
jgi:hypothetical protein